MAFGERLREAVAALEAPVFAVLDGAQFDDLPRALLGAELRHRPLYHDRGDNHPERLLTAPQLVWLDAADAAPQDLDAASPSPSPDRSDADRLLALVGDRPAAVFWQCPTGGEALYRHLRTINMVRIPRARSDADAGLAGGGERAERGAPSARGDPETTHEAVLFRHADANVMGQVVPVLGEPELARLLGPASAVFFAPDAEPGGPEPLRSIKLVRRRAGWRAPKSGLLEIQPHQYEAMKHARLERSRRRLMTYLRDCASDDTRGLSDDALYQQVLVAEKSGRDLGLRSEAAHGQWAFLMLTTGGEVAKGPPVRKALAEAKDPDAAVGDMMREMVRLSQAEARGMRLPGGST